MTDDNVTAAELDDLEKHLAASIKLQAGTGFVRLKLGTAHTIADALATLRKQLDEAQDRLIVSTRVRKNALVDAERLRASNVQMAAALREIDSFYRQGIDDRTFAGCVGDVLKRYAASQEAPAHDGCCNCETCIEARSRGPRYKGDGNTPMQKEDYNGSCQ